MIYFTGGNSCFRNAIRAWPLAPRAPRSDARGTLRADADDDDDDDNDENGSGLEIAALIRIRYADK